MSGVFFNVISAEKRGKGEEVERPDEARHGFKRVAFEPG